MKRCKSKNCKL